MTTWTIRSLLTWARGYFEKKEIDSPRLTAEILIAHALDLRRVQLYLDLDRPLVPEELAKLRALVERRAAGEPMQYIAGALEFYGRKIQVDPRCFIPRPETEHLVERALSALPKGTPDLRALELCTGSGAVAATLACERPQISITAIELSPEAAAVARANSERLAPNRVRILEGDLFSPLTTDERFHVIVANPPYLRRTQKLPRHIVDHEPHLALFGGEDGLDVMRRIVSEAPRWLMPGGRLVVEMDESQDAEVTSLFKEAGFTDVEMTRDLQRLPRNVGGVHSGQAGQVRRPASPASAAGQSPGAPLSRGAEGGT